MQRVDNSSYRRDGPDRLFGLSVVKVDFARVRRVLLPRAGGQQLLDLSLEAVGFLPRALLGSTGDKNSQIRLLLHHTNYKDYNSPTTTKNKMNRML